MRDMVEIADQPRNQLPDFRPGDTVRVHVRISEGDKTRIQVFEGVVLQRHRGGANASFTVRKVSYGVGVERIFPDHSPIVSRVEVKARGRVRRSKLYYLRERTGKAARIRTRLDRRDGPSRVAAAAPTNGPTNGPTVDDTTEESPRDES